MPAMSPHGQVLLRYPDTSSDINEKVLLSECYNNLSLSDDILHRFYLEVEEINASTPISEEIMMHINTSKIVQELLESKTYNDTSLYTDRTTAEILQEIEISRNLKNVSENEKVHLFSFRQDRIRKTIRYICSNLKTRTK